MYSLSPPINTKIAGSRLVGLVHVVVNSLRPPALEGIRKPHLIVLAYWTLAITSSNACFVIKHLNAHGPISVRTNSVISHRTKPPILCSRSLQ